MFKNYITIVNRQRKQLLTNKFFLAAVCLVVLFQFAILYAYTLDDGFPLASYRQIKEYIRSGGAEAVTEVEDYYQALTDTESTATYRPMWTSSATEEEQLLTYVCDELSYIENYPVYIDNTLYNGEVLGQISIFSADKSEFSKRNVTKTAADFSQMDDLTPAYEGTKGLVRLMDISFSGILLYLILIFAAMLLVMETKKRGEQNLYNTTKNGRSMLAFAKLHAMLTVTCAMVVVLQLLTVIYARVCYGSVDMSAPVQSLYGFEGSVYRMTIGEYLVVLTLVRVACTFLLSLVLFLVDLYAANEALAVGAAFVFYAAAELTKLIPAQSSFYGLRYFAVSSLLDTKGFLQDYLNLNLFAHPVSLGKIAVVFIALMILACAALFIRRFPAQSLPKAKHAGSGWFLAYVRKLRAAKGEKRQEKTGGEIRVYPLAVFEAKKSLIYGKMAILFLAGLVGVSFYCRLGYEAPGLHEQYYRYYMNGYAGELTADKIDRIYAEAVRLDKNYSMITVLDYEYRQGQISQTQYNQLYNTYEKSSLGLTGFQKMEERLYYLQDYEKNTGFLPELLYDDGWDYVLGLGDYKHNNYVFALFVLILVIASVSGVFSSETESGMDQLIYVYKNGRKKLTRDKLKVVMLLVLLSVAVVYIPAFWYAGSTYGLHGLTSLAAAIPTLSSFGGGITLLEYVIGAMLARYILFCLLAYVLTWISRKTGSTVKTMILSALLFGIPSLCLVFF